jgi:hypothetical protein
LPIDKSTNEYKIGNMEDDMTTDKVKIVTHITPATDKKVEEFKKLSGMTKARICALAITAGIDAISLAFDPDWKAYFEAKMAADNEK